MSSSTLKPHHLEPSELGTKEYWDNLYTLELHNNTTDPTDEGTIWFDDSSAEDKVISFLKESIFDPDFLGEAVTRQNAKFLDLGTGNGHFLFRLREGEDDDSEEEEEDAEGEDDVAAGGDGDRGTKKGWGGPMLGIDYSQKSVDFANSLAVSKNHGPSSTSHISFLHHDLITSPAPAILSPPYENGFDIVLDKGTFDAISLSDEKDSVTGRRICESYKEKVVPLIKKGGVLVITSCNWTEEELDGWFLGGDGELVKWKSIEYRSFSFGGKKGQSVSSVCYRRVK